MSYLPEPKGFATRAIHAGQEPEKWDSMSVVAPLVTSTTFKQYGPANFKKYEYSRSGNPTRDVLEECLAALEGAKHGLVFASGLGAITALMASYKSGDHVVSCDDIYGGTFRIFQKVLPNYGISSSFVDATDLNKVEKAIQPNTKLIIVESPTNPTLRVLDIKGLAAIAKKHNVHFAVDNTFLTPYFQRPLELGADIVLYSLTKYMNGHSDVVMGAILTSNDELAQQLRFLQNALGIVPSPFDCNQVSRGLKTLAIRMKQHNLNGLVVAKHLENHPKVESVIHPGLVSHPQHELFKSQTSGHSGVVSFYLKGGLKQSETVLSALKVFTLAESLGGYESLAELPSVMTHASIPEPQRKVLNITDSLIRLSVGLEDAEDLIADLDQALARI